MAAHHVETGRTVRTWGEEVLVEYGGKKKKFGSAFCARRKTGNMECPEQREAWVTYLVISVFNLHLLDL